MGRSVDWLVRRVHHPDAARLADLVDDADRFVRDELSQQVRAYPGAADPARIADVDRLWDTALTRGLRAPGFRMVRDGATLARSTLTRSAGIGNETIGDLIEPNKVLELFAEGASLVLQGLHFSDPDLARLANNLSLDLDQPVQVNAYFSPADARGLDLHFDFHDVLVVQLAGSKRWRVWERLERTKTPVRGAPETHLPAVDELGAVRLDQVLLPGDCIHVPRGCPHAPETVDESSAHLTIGLMSFTRRRLVEQALAATHGDPALASLVSAGSLGRDAGGDGINGVGAEADEALERLAVQLHGAALRRQLAIEIWRRQPATRLRPRTPAPMDAGTVVALTPGPLLWAEHLGGDVLIGLGDRQLRLPGEAWPLIDVLLGGAAQSFSCAALSSDLQGCVDADSVRAVVRRLVEEGVLAGG